MVSSTPFGPYQKPVYSPPLLRATNKPDQADRFDLQFAGKPETVKSSFLGTEFEIPQEVVEAGKVVKTLATKKSDYVLSCSNATYLGNDLFLGVAHALNPDVPGGKRIGQYSPNKKRMLHGAEQISIKALRQNLDLSLLQKRGLISLLQRVLALNSDSEPIKLAEHEPSEPGEEVYMVGHHTGFKGLQYIPATFDEKLVKFTDDDIISGFDATYSRIFSKIVDNRHFDTASLSGSPVVNKKGELIGIYACSTVRSVNGKGENTGTLYMIDLDTIKAFLKDSQVST